VNWASLSDILVRELDYQHDISPWVRKVRRNHALSTTREIVSVFKAVIRHAVRLGYCERNPLDLVQLPRAKKKRKALPSIEQLEQAFAWWKRLDESAIAARLDGDERRVYFGWHHFYTLLYRLALRSGELRTLLWTDVTPTEITIRAEVEKTGRGRRVPLTAFESRVIELHRMNLESVGTAPQRHALKAGPVFPMGNGRSTDRDRVAGRLVWYPAIRACGLIPGLRGVRPHTLRAMGITRMSEILPMRTVMAISGHTSVDMHWHYHRSVDGDLDAARELLAATNPARDEHERAFSTSGQAEDSSPGVVTGNSKNNDIPEGSK